MRALVIGSSGGIGSALVQGLRARGGEVLGLSRRDHGLDVTDEASVARVMAEVEGSFDLVLVASGALVIDGKGPEKSLRSLEAQAMADQFAVNAIGPALILKHAPRLLPRDREARLAVLSARVGSIGDNALGGWYSYRAAKAALNQLLHTAAIELARTHPKAVLCAIHPGSVATPLTEVHGAGHERQTPEAAAGHILTVLGGLTPAETGGFFDWQGKVVPW